MCTEIHDIKSQIIEVFGPLAGRLGLHTHMERELSNTVVSIGFAAKYLGFELNVDLADFFIYAILFRPTEGEIPVGTHDAAGNRKKIYIQEALKQLGFEITKTTQRLQRLGGDHRNCFEMLTIIKDMVENHWADLEAEQTRWFGESA